MCVRDPASSSSSLSSSLPPTCHYRLCLNMYLISLPLGWIWLYYVLWSYGDKRILYLLVDSTHRDRPLEGRPPWGPINEDSWKTHCVVVVLLMGSGVVPPTRPDHDYWQSCAKECAWNPGRTMMTSMIYYGRRVFLSSSFGHDWRALMKQALCWIWIYLGIGQKKTRKNRKFGTDLQFCSRWIKLIILYFLFLNKLLQIFFSTFLNLYFILLNWVFRYCCSHWVLVPAHTGTL